MALLLGPTSDSLKGEDARPYFLWWSGLTTREFREALLDPDLAVRSYWLGALLREANTRDVWQFTGPDDIRRLWPQLLRHLGKSRRLWSYLLGLPEVPWPPVATSVDAAAKV